MIFGESCWAFVQRTQCTIAGARQAVVGHLDESDLAIGVVAEPAFDADERFPAVAFAIANALDGVIFNGWEMLDANVMILLAASGEVDNTEGIAV